MPATLLRWSAICTLAIAMPVGAAPVEYGVKGGGGTVTIDREAKTFSIETVGINGHTCGPFDGKLSGPSLERGQSEDCRVTLEPRAGGRLLVGMDESAREACRQMCGMRASFEGDYVALPAKCTQAALNQRQKSALGAYRAKRYAQAFEALSDGLAACRGTMWHFAVWAWSNDAAIAAYHLGRKADCARLSKAVVEDAEPMLEQFRDIAPTDADSTEPLLNAARHNLAKCSGAKG